jgi:hypothetical protein
MSPPINIDGTDITGATIDGQEVKEITIDGQVVFPTTTLPVAYSNLVAWYPFDDSEYGGTELDDVTAILGGSGDDTAFDMTNRGASYISSGGVTDINAGSNSGYFDFGDFIETSTQIMQSSFTISFWARTDSGASGRDHMSSTYYNYNNGNVGHMVALNDDSTVTFGLGDGGSVTGFDLQFSSNTQLNLGSWNHIVMRGNHGGSIDGFIDGNFVGSDSGTTSFNHGNELYIGLQPNNSQRSYTGDIDDYRMYNKELSDSEINQIFTNTLP